MSENGSIAADGVKVFVFYVCAALLLPFLGCAGPDPKPQALVQPDEAVNVHYTCRVENGDIIATTIQSVDRDRKQKKSSVFTSPKEYGAIRIKARQEDDKSAGDQPMQLDQAIKEAIGRHLPGLAKGKSHQLLLTASVPPKINDGTRYLKLAKVRTRPKERRVPTRIYREYHGPLPEIGLQEQYEQAFISTVTRVDDKEVVMRIDRNPNATYVTEFGEGLITDKGDHYRIELDVSVGQLVRNGNLLGRIVWVGPRHFKIDFGHPFGGEKLICKLDIEQNK